MTRARSRLNGERGALTTELAVIMTPFLLGCVALVVFAGRVAQAEGDVQSAAQEGARAATLTGDPGTADAEARRVVLANLATAGVACSNGTDIQIDTSQFGPGGFVTVTVTCSASMGDVSWLAVPGSMDFTGTASEIIDQYRSSGP